MNTIKAWITLLKDMQMIATLISTNIDTHSYVLQEIDKKVVDLDLMLKSSKYLISF